MTEILYEDNHIIAVYKRSSDLAQGDKTGDISLDTEVKKYLATKYKKAGEVFLCGEPMYPAPNRPREKISAEDL